MKRIFISLGVILAFMVLVLVADFVFMGHYADGMNQRLDSLEMAASYEEKMGCAKELISFYKSNDFLAHRLIPTGKLDELEMLLYRLVVFLKAEEDYEASATVAEIKARVNLLYSTVFYHWYHPKEFGIE